MSRTLEVGQLILFAGEEEGLETGTVREFRKTENGVLVEVDAESGLRLLDVAEVMAIWNRWKFWKSNRWEMI